MNIRFKLATLVTRLARAVLDASAEQFLKEKDRARDKCIKRCSLKQQRVQEVKRESEIQYANLEQAMAEELAAVEQRYKLKQDAIEMQNYEAEEAVANSIKELKSVCGTNA